MSNRDRSSVAKGGPGATVTADGDGRRSSWLDRLRLKMSVAFGLKADPVGFVLEDRLVSAQISPDRLIERLASSTKPERLASLMNEAAALLGDVDRLVIAARLSGDDPVAVADRIGVTPDEVAPLYAKVVDRLVERLAWIAAEEARGIAPPERKVLGQARFFGQSAQEIASRSSS